MKKYWVYIMTNQWDTTLYVGVTNNLRRRVEEHRAGVIDAFTKQYQIKKLIYFEEFGTAYDAITREKKLKNWHRQWKINLITKVNPSWKDLSGSINFY